VRTYADNSDRAFIANYSYNNKNETPIQQGRVNHVTADNSYGDMAAFFDGAVLGDATSGRPVTLVFSSGNFGCEYMYNNPQAPTTPTSCDTRSDTVSDPATAKNVITVGATANDRPASEAGEPQAISCSGGEGRPPDGEDTTDIAQLASFSGRGKAFAAYPSASTATNTRIKPDLVAPGMRVFDVAPFDFMKYGYDASGHGTAALYSGCDFFFPVSRPTASDPSGWYTYGTGTSFAAPVVTGVAAHVRQWFLNRGTNNPAPSLIKAALIATADDLGGLGPSGIDHRPSPLQGWGRVDLNRAVASTAGRFWVNESDTPGLKTGDSFAWTLRIGDASQDVYIVLAWSDPPSTTALGNSQVALVNSLRLEVGDTCCLFMGNDFNKVVTGTDDGYSYHFTFGPPGPPDSINNVQAVFVRGGSYQQGQPLAIQVTGQNVTDVSRGPQRFSVYAYNLQ
jgi:subtilisin family serine protease